MSNGLNGQFMANTDAMLRQYVLSTIYLRAGVDGYQQLLAGAGPFSFDLTWGQAWQWLSLRILPMNTNALHDTPIRAYWLPQGGYIDVPVTVPLAPFVFTPELTGCAIYVDRFNANTYRVYHVEIPHRAQQYDNRPHGNGLEESLTFDEYGRANNINRVRATALMQFSDGNWILIGQVIIGAPQGFQNGHAITVGLQRVRRLEIKPLGDLGLGRLFG